MIRSVSVISLFVMAAALVIVPPALADVWYFNDGVSVGGYLWSDDSIGPFWEWMEPWAIEDGDTACTWTDLPVVGEVSAYYACSGPTDEAFMDCEAWAEIYLANNWPGGSNPTTVTLGVGVCGDEQSFVPLAAPVTVNVTNQMGPDNCGFKYLFNFGQISVSPYGQSFIVKITYSGAAYDGHIYWDGECCPSALYIECMNPVGESSWGTIKALYE
jgi:hypothetical protein